MIGEIQQNLVCTLVGCAATAVVYLHIGGCAPGAIASLKHQEPRTYTTNLDTNAEWHDLDAAIAHAASKHELALLQTNTLSQHERLYTLLSATDIPVWIRFDRTSLHNQTANNLQATAALPVRISICYSDFGDDKKEQALLTTLTHRLAKLIAVD